MLIIKRYLHRVLVLGLLLQSLFVPVFAEEGQPTSAEDVSQETAEEALQETTSPEDTIPMVLKQGKAENSKKEESSLIHAEFGERITLQDVGSIPDLRKYSQYKYIFHNTSDKGLSFVSVDAVKLRYIDAQNKEKEITLNSSDYQVITPQNAKGKELSLGDESFQVRISDLKTVYEAKTGLSSETDPQVYNGVIIVSYTAVLNKETSGNSLPTRYQDRVKIEYSNHPEDGGKETGFSSESVAEVLTYRLYGNVKDLKQTLLKGTRFRLYRDKECTKEILLQKHHEEYHLSNDLEKRPQEIIADAQGSFRVVGLKQGTYYLKETKAAPGYQALSGVIQINIESAYDPTQSNPGSLQASSSYLRSSQDDTGLLHPTEKTLKTNTNKDQINLMIKNIKTDKATVASHGSLLGLLGGAILFGWLLFRKHSQRSDI